MAQGRTFKTLTTREEGSKSKVWSIIKCEKCEATERHWLQRKLNPIVSKRFFTNLGWIVGKNYRTDRCPDCKNKLNYPQLGIVGAKLLEATKTKIKEEPKHMTLKVVQPRKMLNIDRRLIFAKLEECYVDEKHGYTPSWTDARVSEDLGIPRAWVEEIRDQNFGPAFSAKHSEGMKEIAALRVLVNAQEDLIKTSVDQIDMIKNQVLALENKIKKDFG